MKTAIIYVFSGTYHTLKAAAMICDALERSCFKTRVCEIRMPFNTIPSPDGYDIVGFGYPVHAFNAPEVFIRFVRNLPSGSSRCFIFKTSGEPFCLTRTSSNQLYRILRRKGYDVGFETHMLMPYNIMFRYPPSLVKQMYLYTEAQSRLTALRILRGERDTLRFSLFSVAASFLFRIEWLAPRINSPFCSAKKSRCTKCGLCVRKCPMQNIRFDSNGGLHFGGHCALCMRCVMFCPRDAIHFGILHFWRVNGAYDFKRLIHDPAVPADFVREDTKGYFRLFRKFFRDLDASLIKYGIRVAAPSEGAVLIDGIAEARKDACADGSKI